jgi:hypothetical protein
MSTKNTTTSTNSNVFDPQSMGRYQQFGSAGGTALLDMLQDPLKQTGFNQRVAQGNQFAFNLATRNNSNIMNRASLFGGNNIPGFLQNQLGQSQNWLAGQQSQNFNQNLLYADQMRQMAMGQALGYRPLQTGATGQQTQSQSGLGTWLPQVAGMALGAATGGLGSLAMGATSGLFKGGSSQALNNSIGSNNSFIGGMDTSMNMGGLTDPSSAWFSGNS